MKQFLFRTARLAVVLFLSFSVLPAQSWQPVAGADTCAVYHELRFTMQPSVYKKITAARGVKMDVREAGLRVDGAPAAVKSLRLRGKSTLGYRRKSFTVELEKARPVPLGSSIRTLRKFYLLNLAMDRSYFHNRLAFLCLRELGLFPLANAYAEVFINNESQGLYLLMERPRDVVLDELGGSYLMRRAYRERIEDFDVAKKTSEQDTPAFNALYPELIRACRESRGEELYQRLSARLDVEAYFRWLAFNFWVRNGDYTDELFLYAYGAPDTARLRPLAWDYDDIFSTWPHEGSKARAVFLGDRDLLFSGECELDRTIAHDTVLYARYQTVLREVLLHFDEARLRRIFDALYCELLPYIRRPAVAAASRHDAYGATGPEMLVQELAQTFESLLLRRREDILTRLE